MRTVQRGTLLKGGLIASTRWQGCFGVGTTVCVELSCIRGGINYSRELSHFKILIFIEFQFFSWDSMVWREKTGRIIAYSRDYLVFLFSQVCPDLGTARAPVGEGDWGRGCLWGVA